MRLGRGMLTQAAHCAVSVLIISLNSLTRPKTWTLLDAPWMFVRRSQSAMTGEICDADESPLQELL